MENKQLTISDLAALHRIIDIACSRGSFKGAEMTEVGSIYDKLTSFLASVQEQARAQAESQAAEANNQGDANA
jgi:hypothetical protein